MEKIIKKNIQNGYKTKYEGSLFNMKKLLSMVLLFVFVLSLVGCKDQDVDNDTTNESNETVREEESTDTYAEQIQLFVAEKDVWLQEDFGPYGVSVAVYDLDGDGVLELMTTVVQGTGLYALNNFYQADLENGCLVELKQGPEDLLEYGEVGLELASYGYEQRNNVYIDENGRMMYSAVDYGRAGMAFSSCAEGVYYLENGVVMSQLIRSYTTDYTENEDGVITYYVSEKEEPVTKEEWEAEYTNFTADKEVKKVNIGWKDFLQDEMLEFSSEEWSDILTSSWEEASCSDTRL